MKLQTLYVRFLTKQFFPTLYMNCQGLHIYAILGYFQNIHFLQCTSTRITPMARLLRVILQRAGATMGSTTMVDTPKAGTPNGDSHMYWR